MSLDKGGVGLLVETEHRLRAADEDRTSDEIWLLDHQIDRFLLRSRQRTLLEDRASRADVIEEPAGVDVMLEERAIRGIAVDVTFVDLDVVLLQKPSGVAARSSGRLPEERGLSHPNILRR